MRVKGFVSQRGALLQCLQSSLDPIGQPSNDGMKPPVRLDNRTGRPPAQKFSYRQRRPVVAFKIPSAGFAADRAATVVQESRPFGTAEASIIGIVNAQSGRRAKLSEQVIDAVALIVAEINGIPEAAGAQVDRTHVSRLVAAKHKLVGGMRQCEHCSPNVAIKP